MEKRKISMVVAMLVFCCGFLMLVLWAYAQSPTREDYVPAAVGLSGTKVAWYLLDESSGKIAYCVIKDGSICPNKNQKGERIITLDNGDVLPLRESHIYVIDAKGIQCGKINLTLEKWKQYLAEPERADKYSLGDIEDYFR